MASTNKCEYCGSTITSQDQSCPNCGATNPLYVVDLPRKVTDPKTIEELQEYCAERGMPLLRMRFFIGQDTREAKAFGIYREGQEFTVYKNKADGTRAVRYRGPDEAKAVSEIFDKLIEECHRRGIYPDGKPSRQTESDDGYRGSGSSGAPGGGGNLLKTVVTIVIIIIIINLLFSCTTGHGLGSFFSGGGYSGGYGYYDDNNSTSWWSDDNGSSWWSSDDDNSWWSSDDNSSWWSNDNDSWSDNDWGGWDDWDAGDTDWDDDW